MEELLFGIQTHLAARLEGSAEETTALDRKCMTGGLTTKAHGQQ